MVVLDTVHAPHPPDLSAWDDYIGSKGLATNRHSAWDFADARSESPAESKSRAPFHTLGFRAPSLQSTIQTEAGSYRCDFCWEEDRVVGEVDGRLNYYDPAMLARHDPQRLARRLIQAGVSRRAATRISQHWTTTADAQGAGLKSAS